MYLVVIFMKSFKYEFFIGSLEPGIEWDEVQLGYSLVDRYENFIFEAKYPAPFVLDDAKKADIKSLFRYLSDQSKAFYRNITD